MKLRLNAKIDSKSSDAGLFGLYRFYHAREGMTLQLHPWKVLYIFAIMAVIGYIGAVGGAYYIRSKRPHNTITLADFALPWKWSGISEKAGKTNLAHGKELFESEQYPEAMHMLRAGLRRAPGDHEARKQLAIIYQAYGNSEGATNVLGIGLDYGYPDDTDYIDLLLGLLALREDYGAFGDITYKLRQFPEVREDKERWERLAKWELETHKRERDYEQMLAYAREMQEYSPDKPEYDDLEALALIKLGFDSEALAVMESMPLGRQHSPHYRFLEAMMALQGGDIDELEELMDTIMRWPTQPYTLQTQAILELDYADMPDRRDAYLQQYLEQYQDNAAAIELAIRIFNEHLGVERTDALIARLDQLEPSRTAGMQLFAIQSRLLDGQFTSAREVFKEWVQHEEVKKQLSKYEWLQQLLTVLTEKREDDRKALWDLTRQRRFPNSVYVVCARALVEGEDYATAERIAENGLLFYPHDKTLSTLRRDAVSGG